MAILVLAGTLIDENIFLEIEQYQSHGDFYQSLIGAKDSTQCFDRVSTVPP